MDDAKYDDLIGHRVKIDRVRKASHESAACLTVDARVGERCLDDTAKDHVDFRCKGAPKPWTLFLVPVTGVEQLCLRLRAENKTRLTLLGGASDVPRPRGWLKPGRRCAEQGGDRVRRVARS